MGWTLERGRSLRFEIKGVLESYVRGVTEQWLKPAPNANPGMLDMFADRDRRPYRDLVPWAGEFSGKYLTGAVEVLRLMNDPDLRDRLRAFVGELTGLQAPDGYLGPWPKASRLTNKAVYPDGRQIGTWDTWGHYHNMLGLLLWHEDTGEARALRSVRRMADLLCERYGGEGKPNLADSGNSEMNLAPAHSMCLLFRRTRERKYLEWARRIVEVEFAGKDNGRWSCGNYLEGALSGLEFFELPKPRWESLHPIMALAELHELTGEVRYRTAFERLWWSIAHLDRHNNGGFSSGEQAQGNPFHGGAIETCCTIAWMAMSVYMLKLTGDARVADELELSLLNSVVGMHAASGRWATYNTPMDGVRRASAHDIVFQSREGAPELNCCSVNSARGFGLLGDWALMRDAEGVVLNAYGPGVIRTVLDTGAALTLTQTTDYPRGGRVELAVAPARALTFTLKLRIPRWSRHTRVAINGRPVQGATPGTYLSLTRRWKRGDRVTVHFDMSFHFWVGEEECAGKVSVYRGPLLLTYDRRFNEMDPDDVPTLDPRRLKGRVVTWRGRMPPILLMAIEASNGTTVRLCDFGSAGEGGAPYRSWLPLAVGLETDGLFQPYASPRAVLEAARLLRFANCIRNLPTDQRRVESGFLKPEDFVMQLDRMDREWLEFQNNLERVRVMVVNDPQSDTALYLESVLKRLEQEGVTAQARRDEIVALKEDFRRKYLESMRLTRFDVSSLFPPPADIRSVSLPPADTTFVPGTALESVGLCDVRPVHGGRHGLVYVRLTHVRQQAGVGSLLYGADGPVKVWVNGREAGCQPEATNPAMPGRYQANVEWRAGENMIVFALLTQHGCAWGVFAAVDRPVGT
jgi:hypothetical protein